jgi:transposase
MRTPVRLPDLGSEAIAEPDHLYRTTDDMRLRMRSQIVLPAAEQHMLASEIARIVRSDDQTVRTCLKRYLVQGIAGMSDAPRPGAQAKVTPDYRAQLLETVRQRPRSLGQPCSLWTLQRLADYMANQTGIRVSHITTQPAANIDCASVELISIQLDGNGTFDHGPLINSMYGHTPLCHRHENLTSRQHCQQLHTVEGPR